MVSVSRETPIGANNAEKEEGPRAARDVDLLACLGVYDGQDCIGYLLPRDEQGVEAYGADDASLGLYPTQKKAADAVSAAAMSNQSSEKHHD